MTSGVIAWLALHALLAVAGTWLARRYAVHRRLLDEPGERRSHMTATPRGGGISIVFCLLLALAWLVVDEPSQRVQLALVAAGLVMVAGIGWVDDHRPLSTWLRLGVHAVAAVLLAVAAWRAGAEPLAVVLAFGLALVLTNVWNFMDGIDGLATSQAALVGAALAWAGGPGPGRWLALALVAACLGFLPFNFPRARIFLGDVGSGAIGYTLAVVLALNMSHGSMATWAAWLLPLSVFLVDAALTLATRMVRRERWWTPHLQHVYQRLARRWDSHRRVTMAYAGLTFLAIAFMWLVRSQPQAIIMSAVCGWYLMGAGTWLSLRRRYGEENRSV